ncbi:tautomerase family protein [Musicola keenii]
MPLWLTNLPQQPAVINEVDTDNWGIGGVPLTELRQRS